MSASDLEPWRSCLPDGHELQTLPSDVTSLDFDRWLADPANQSVRALSLSHQRRLRDDDFAKLERLSQLEVLLLENVVISDAGLAAVARIPALRALQTWNASHKIGDAGLRALSALQRLEVLVVWDSPIHDDAIAALASLSHLRVLRVGLAKVKGVGFAALSALPLSEVNLWGNPLTEAGIKELTKCRNIQRLVVGNANLNSKKVRPIGNLLELTHLDASGGVIDDAGLLAFAEATQLRHLDLRGNPIPDRGLRALRGMTALECIDLGDSSDVSPTGIIDAVGSMPRFDDILFGLTIRFGDNRPLGNPGTVLNAVTGGFTGKDLRELVAAPSPAQRLRTWRRGCDSFWR